MKISLTLIIILTFTVLSSGGPNSNAVIYVNFKPDTSVIDSVKLCKQSDTVIAAIQIANSVNLFDFEIHIGIDTSRLEFLTGKKESIDKKNILETKGGSSFFQCAFSKKDSTKIILGASILGGDQTQCPAGSGFLGFLYFRKKTSDTTLIKIYSSLLETFSSSVDTVVKSVSGSIYPGSSAIIERNTIQSHFTVQKAGQLVTIYTPEITPQSIQLFTIDGRCLTKIVSSTRKTCLSLPSSIGKGPCIIRIQNNDNIYSSLLINN
jgi:hypothetical protein